MTDSILGWVSNEITRNQEYHNHKETMGWVATALFVTGVLVLGWQLNEIEQSKKIIAIVVVSAIAGLAFWFVIWQLNYRSIAAERVKNLVEISEVYLNLQQNRDAMLITYISEIKTHKLDPNKTMIISILVMAISYVTFIISICS